MKKIIVLFIALFTVSALSAQIHFETGNWSEVKAKAKKENKLIFLDVYTSWCGPCKMMVKNIFPLKEVGVYYNQNFICYKIDAEVGEGVKIASTYKVSSYPTYLYIDGDGVLFYRSGGSMPAEKFITEGETAQAEFTDKTGFEEMGKQLAKKRKDRKFLRDYIAKRTLRKMNSADLLDEYILLCKNKPELILNKEFATNLWGNGVAINAGGACYRFMVENVDAFPELLKVDRSHFINGLKVMTISKGIETAAANSDEAFYERILKANKELCLLAGQEDPESDYYLTCCFYGKTKQGEKLDAVAETYADLLIAKIPEIKKLNEVSFGDWVKKVIAEQKEVTNMTAMAQNALNKNSYTTSYRLRDLANWVASSTTNPQMKLKALDWAFIASNLAENFSNYEILGEVYYQLGRHKEAKFWTERAQQMLPSAIGEHVVKRINDRLVKIEQAIQSNKGV